MARSESSPAQVATFERQHAFLGQATFQRVNDTSAAANARYHELLRGLPPVQRLEAAMRLSRAVRALAESGIRQRHPLATDAQVKVRLTVRLYGRDVAVRLFGAVPDDAV